MNDNLYELFIDELADMYNSEKQIVRSLPKLIKAASLSQLKDALSNHLRETENQVKRIEKVFAILEMSPKDEHCEAMEGLLKEADRLVGSSPQSPTLDAAIISAAQKVEHYEIASYGTLISFAKTLDLDRQVHRLLEDTLGEESGADKKLTKIADGSFFTEGVNRDAAETSASRRRDDNRY